MAPRTHPVNPPLCDHDCSSTRTYLHTPADVKKIPIERLLQKLSSSAAEHSSSMLRVGVQKNRSTAKRQIYGCGFSRESKHAKAQATRLRPILFYSNTSAFSPTYQHTEQHIFGARAWDGGINDIEYRLVRVGDLLGREALAVRRHCSKVRDDVKILSNGPEWRRKSDWCSCALCEV